MRLALIDAGVFTATTRADLAGRGCDPGDLIALVRRLNDGRDLAGTRYSPLTQINTTNVASLKEAWTYRLRPAAGRSIRPSLRW